MFANALFYPERFAGNTVLIDGVMEIIRSIRGDDVTYEQIIAELTQTPQDILDRYAHEQELIALAQGQTTVEPTQEQPSPEELERIRQEQELYEKQTQQYWDMIQQGIVSPDLPIAADSVRKSVEAYANAYTQVYAEYGDLIFYASTSDNMNFDPDQDIWITRNIGFALNPDIIGYIVTDPDYAENIINELESHTRILNEFIQSDAFRTNVTARIL
jgi:hypothetical protein